MLVADDAIYRRKLRKDRASQGFCSCGVKRDSVKRLCAACRARTSAKKQAQRDRRTAQGICYHCSEPLKSPHRLCPKCLATHLVRSQKLRAKYLSKGICIRCRERQVVQGRTLCVICSAAAVAQKREKATGVSPQMFAELLSKQKGRCAICRVPFGRKKQTKAHADHDHATKCVRGLLCNKCNHLLGMCDDSVQVLRNAIKYLVKARLVWLHTESSSAQGKLFRRAG